MLGNPAECRVILKMGMASHTVQVLEIHSTKPKVEDSPTQQDSIRTLKSLVGLKSAHDFVQYQPV